MMPVRAECRFCDGTVLAEDGQPYFVAEVNSSHNGNLETARAMIDAAADAGCNCVKFQSWSAASLYAESYYKENPIAKRFVERFALVPAALKEMADYCRDKGLAFSSTPYSEEEVDFLVDECRVPFVKIASMELNNLPFLEYIGRKAHPVVLSTGMGTMAEIRRAVEVLERAGTSDLLILHCISVYPAAVEMLQLRNIVGLRRLFPHHPIGFSDHSEGFAAAVVAIALGAVLIEKHLTLDRTKVGMDNNMAAEPGDFKELIVQCDGIYRGLGAEERVLSTAEAMQREKMRRSVIVTRDLCAGDVLTRADLYAKRPGTGIPPEQMEQLIGKKLIRDVAADTLLHMEDIEGGEEL